MESKLSVSTLSKSEIISGILMIASFILAIFISNIAALAHGYVKFVFNPVFFGIGQFHYQTTLINLVNDGLMTFFFLLIGLELKYHLVLGEYQDLKTLILPSAAALGGIVVPALIYMYFNFGEPGAKGWAVPIATDTAFMLAILSFFNKHVSGKLRAFIISFSLIDDALALSILAIFYTKSTNILALSISLGILILLIILNRIKIQNVAYYLVLGVVLWFAMVEAGIHGTLCGAILAITIPAKIGDKPNNSFKSLENILRPMVHYGILPLFIFINSGVTLSSLSIDTLASDISIGIILGLFVGKQLGIASFSYFAIKNRWCSLPSDVTWKKFYAVCILGGIGFTLSLFIGDLTFEAGEPHYAMRSAVIIASLLSALFGTVLFAYSTKKEA